MFGQLLAQHFVHTALWAGAVVAVVSGAIGVFVVARGMSFAVHAISELGFTGAAGALVLGIDPVLGMLGGSLLVGLVLGLLSLRGRERDSAIGAVLAFGLGVGVLFLSLYQGYATEATNLLFGSIVGVSDAQLRDLLIVGGIVIAGLAFLYRPLFFTSVRTSSTPTTWIASAVVSASSRKVSTESARTGTPRASATSGSMLEKSSGR